MATLFRSLFGHKKHHGKAEDDNGNEPQIERDISRRSHRSTSSTRTARGARFRDDSMLPPTAAYHTQNTTRVRRGPKSCPGEYVEDDEPMSSRSFNVDAFRHPEPNRRRSNNNQMMPSTSMMTTSSSSHRAPAHYHQRWETSEYGSENTSPIGYHRHPQHRRHQDEEEEEEEEEEEVFVQTNRYQEVKRKIRQHYEEKLFNYSQKVKELEKEKSDLVSMLIQLNAKSEKDKKKIEYFKRKWQESEQQKMQQQQGFNGQFGFQTPQFPMFQFGPPAGTGPSQRYSFMGAPMHPISSTNTPTTSAMDTTSGGGAGESLFPTTDMSFLANLNSSMPPLELPAMPVSTGNTSGTQPPGSLFNDDEDEDETKNFREEMEVPRGSLNTLTNEGVEEETEDFANAANETMLIEGQDSGFSTTPEASKTEEVRKE